MAEPLEQAAVAQELAGKQNIAHFRKVKAAAEQPGLFGDVQVYGVDGRRPHTLPVGDPTV